MKKICFLGALLFLCILTANAQWRFTPGLGVTVFKEKGNLEAGVGAKVGVGVRYSFNGDDDRWGIVSGLYYSQRNAASFSGGELTGSLPGLNGVYPVAVVPGSVVSSIPGDMHIEGASFMRITTRRDYLQVPILLQYAWKITPDIRYHIAAGPYLAVGIGGRNKISCTAWDTGGKLEAATYTDNPFSLLRYDRFDVGASVQTGIEVKNISFLLGYDINLYKRNLTGKEHVISIGMGYTF